jgi:hypothetical protein
MTMKARTTKMAADADSTDIAAAWIVAAALIAAIVVHLFLPATPPRLGHGVAGAAAARVQTNLPGGSVAADSDVPLVEHDEGFGSRAGAGRAPAEVGSASPVIPPTVPRPAE